MRIFVVSLKDATDRRSYIQKMMDSLGIEFEFFDAVDARKGVAKEYEMYIDRENAEKNLRRPITNAEIGCALSHGLLWQKICQENISDTIILEDDCIVDTDFAEVLQKSVLQVHTAGFILLCHLGVRGLKSSKKTLYKHYNTMRVINEPSVTAGYYITKTSAEQLLAKTLPISYVADWGTDVAAMGTLAVTPRLVRHPTQEMSSIESQRQQNKRKKYAGSAFGRLGFVYWLRYKLCRPFSVQISKTIEGE